MRAFDEGKSNENLKAEQKLEKQKHVKHCNTCTKQNEDCMENIFAFITPILRFKIMYVFQWLNVAIRAGI